MPNYTVQDSKTDRTVTFEWNGPKPPTQADMAKVFKAAGDFQGGQQTGQLPGKPGMSEQQKFYEERFKPAQHDIEDLTKGEADWKGFGPATGATIGTKLGMPFGLPGMVGGAAIGGAGGMAYEQIAKHFQGKGPETSTEAMQEINKAAALGGGGEMAGPAAGQVLKPIGREMGPLTQKLWETAKKAKLPLPASAFKDSKSIKAFEWFGRVMPTGRGVMQHQRKGLSNNLEKMMDDVVKKIPVKADKFEAGEKLVMGLDKAKLDTANAAKAQYGLWKKSLGEGRSMANTVNVMQEQAGSIKDPTIRAYLEAFSAKGKDWVAKDIYDYQKLIWAKTYKKMPHLGGKLQEALKKDLGKDVYKKLQEGKQAYAQARKLSENKTIKAMARKYKIDGENVLYPAFRSGNFEDVALMKASVDKETWDIATSRFVENIIDTAMDSKTHTQFTPDVFVKNFEKFGRQIENVMPEIYENMNDFYLMAKQAQPFSKQMQPLEGMAKMAMQGLAIGGAGGIYANPWVAVPFGFSAAVAHSITRPAGYLKKYLVTGFPGMAETAKQTLRVGGRAAMMKGEDK